MLKLIHYFFRAKGIKESFDHPDEFIKNTSLGFIEGYFVTAGIVLSLLTIASLSIGYYFSLSFFVVVGYIFLVIAVITAVLYLRIRKLITRLSQRAGERARKTMTRAKNTINVESRVVVESKKYEE
ncbi:hypothetical protein CL684_02640 [Candidatus Campbellbacteria bacterium]|nr:hypothetical protein [Candidatus Campbellbacteria bacterium]|tara:strand:+ start:64 stop:441 length:378 start_codon:yes stop_codon:yes gene_type:complete